MVTDKDREAVLYCAPLTEERSFIVAEKFAAHREAAIAERDAQLVKWLRDVMGEEYSTYTVIAAIEAGEPWK